MLIAACALAACVGCTGKTELAEMAIRRGEMEEAARLLREFVADHPHDVLALRRLAQVECYELNDCDSCAQHVETLLWMIPIDSLAIQLGAYAYTMIAAKARDANDTVRVRQAMKRVSDIYYTAADWNYQRWNYPQAVEQYREVIRLNPGWVKPYLRLGITFWAQRLWNPPTSDSALAWFLRAEELEPDNEDALVNQMVVHREEDRMDEALAIAERLSTLRARLYPDSSFGTSKLVPFESVVLNYAGDREMITDSPIYYADTTQEMSADTISATLDSTTRREPTEEATQSAF